MQFRLSGTMRTVTRTRNAMPDIVLATLNAKYIHASLGLRYLYANLAARRERACRRGAGTLPDRAPRDAIAQGGGHDRARRL